MAKKKVQKKEEVVIENIEQEVVSFEETNIEQVDVEKSMEELDKMIEEITPIDMSAELEEIRKEIFEEEPKKEVVKEAPKKEVKVEEPKTIKSKIMGTANRLFGFTWNGMEYDY